MLKKAKNRWGGNLNHKPLYFDSIKTLGKNRDLWFILPPQQSFLVSWLFLAIAIPCLKILFFIILVCVLFSFFIHGLAYIVKQAM